MNKKILGKQKVLIGIGLLSFLSLFIYLIEILSPESSSPNGLATNILVSSVFLIGIAIIDFYLVKYINRAKWLQERLILRIIFEALLLSTLAVLFVLLGNLPFKYNGDITDYIYLIVEREAAIASILLNTFCVIVLEFFFHMQLGKKREIELQQMQTENAEMQYKQLKGQINPHFLFNSLNILVSLINKDARRATEYTKKLSDVYRYVLTYDKEDTVTVAEETDFIQNYIHILKIRFDKGLEVDIHLPEQIRDKKIIPMTLQILVENAIKHNIVSVSRRLKIEIGCEEEFIFVTNKVALRSNTGQSTGIGLKNLSQKYKFLSDKDIIISEENDMFTVKIPLL
ncbi:MAG: sensor histidine kinase [Candidatus Azobacteroides sp.]|nr:sensor histidine kinase [Candidatus Azobacteroides sp.]